MVGFHSIKQKFAFQIGVDFHHGLRAASTNTSIEYMPGPSLHRNLVTRETLNQLVSHALANHGEGWRFLKVFVRTVDEYIKELENLVVD